MDTKSHLFLSYSRRQFYFAESVVLSLQEAGEQVWFDVQELAPGEYWRDEIQRGLEEARGIIVIVSRASMASPYVRLEWEPMIAANKPIYLVLFESTHVPPELEQAATAIIDLRGRFNASVKELVNVIRGEPSHQISTVPSPGIFGLPRRISFSNGVLLTILLGTVAILLMNILSYVSEVVFRDIFAIVLLLAIYAFYIGETALGILQRRHTFIEVIISTVISTGVMINTDWYFVPLPLIALAVFTTSPGTYRWLPTGQAPKWMRRRYGIAAAPTLTDMAATLDQLEVAASQRYTISYAHEDHWIAEQIEETLQADGHQRITHEEDTPGTQHIVILSEHTPIEMVNGLLQRHADTLTPVLASNVAARETVEALGNFQFIDFREHAHEQLEAISLFYKHPEHAKVIYGFNVLPLSTTVLRWPREVARFNRLNHLTFLVYIALTLSLPMLWVPVVSWGTFADFIPYELAMILPYGALATAIGAVLHVRLAHLAQNRRLTFEGFKRRMWGLGLLSLLTGTFGLPVIITYWVTRHAMHHWLPHEIHAKKDTATLPPAVQRAALSRALRDGGLALLLVALLLTDSALIGINDPDLQAELEEAANQEDEQDNSDLYRNPPQCP